MSLVSILEQGALLLNMESSSKEPAIQELLDAIVAKGGIPTDKRDEVFQAILEREAQGSTGLGQGIAIPHVRDCPHVDGLVGAFGRSEQGIPFEAIDGNPVHLVFLLVGGEGTSDDHMQFLRSLASLRQHDHFLRFLEDATDNQAVLDVVQDLTSGA